MRMAIFVLLLVAAPAAAGEKFFDGCKIQENKPGERRIDCPEFGAAATEEKPAFGAEPTLEMVMRALREQPGTRVEPGEITVAGAKRRGFRWVAAGTSGVAVAFPSSEGKFRLLTCEEKKVKRCDAVMGALAAAIPAPNTKPARASDEKSIAGRAVTPPEGCSQPGPRKIRCAAAELTWATIADDDPPGFDWIWNPLKKAFASQGAITESRRACAVDGVEGDCRQLAIAKPDGKSLAVMGALVSLRGARIFVQCNISAPLGTKVPPPCDQVLGLR